MSGSGGLFAAWHVSVGPLALTDVVIVTWVIMSVIAALSCDEALRRVDAAL